MWRQKSVFLFDSPPLFLQRASALPVPPHRSIAEEKKENFQNRSYHMIIDERNKLRLKETIGLYFQRAILAVDSEPGLWISAEML